MHSSQLKDSEEEDDDDTDHDEEGPDGDYWNDIDEEVNLEGNNEQSSIFITDMEKALLWESYLLALADPNFDFGRDTGDKTKVQVQQSLPEVEQELELQLQQQWSEFVVSCSIGNILKAEGNQSQFISDMEMQLLWESYLIMIGEDGKFARKTNTSLPSLSSLDSMLPVAMKMCSNQATKNDISPGQKNRRTVIENGIKVNHLCVFCMKVLTTKFKLFEHITAHTGETPFFCQFCDQCFNRERRLITHVIQKCLKKINNFISLAIKLFFNFIHFFLIFNFR